MVTINCQHVPSNVIVGLRCHRKQQNIECKLEKFSVLETLFNMDAKKKKNIGMLDGFEGLLKYYVKLTSTQFIEQWVTPELYNELLLEIFSSHHYNKRCPYTLSDSLNYE
jgi:hypothetical protein